MNSSIHSISFGPGGASKSNNQEQLIVTLAVKGGKLKASSWRREFQRRFLRAFKRRHLKASGFPSFPAGCLVTAAAVAPRPRVRHTAQRPRSNLNCSKEKPAALPPSWFPGFLIQQTTTRTAVPCG
jgi:hypothetical protein